MHVSTNAKGLGDNKLTKKTTLMHYKPFAISQMHRLFQPCPKTRPFAPGTCPLMTLSHFHMTYNPDLGHWSPTSGYTRLWRSSCHLQAPMHFRSFTVPGCIGGWMFTGHSKWSEFDVCTYTANKNGVYCTGISILRGEVSLVYVVFWKVYGSAPWVIALG